MAREYKQITIWVRDGEDSLEHLLRYLKQVGNMGHSFSIVVDPDNSDYKKIFGWDGDGADHIGRISVKRTDSLQKAEARGGKYYRRVPKPGGGWNYIYKPEDYHQRKDAHTHGPDAAKEYIAKRVTGMLENAKKGLHPKELEGLVKKYGVDTVAAVLDEHHKAGKITLKKGKIHAANGKSKKA